MKSVDLIFAPPCEGGISGRDTHTADDILPKPIPVGRVDAWVSTFCKMELDEQL